MSKSKNMNIKKIEILNILNIPKVQLNWRVCLDK